LKIQIEDSSHVLRIEKFEFPTKALKTDSVCPSKVLSSKEAKRVSAEERRELERSKFYVAYQPSDMKSEKVLSVEHNTFDAQAKLCGVDISADDDKQLYLETQRKRW
jgi:hypothetical protein